MDNRILYITNPSKVPERYKKYLYPVIVDQEYIFKTNKIGYPPKMVIHHSYLPSFSQIINKLRKLGCNLYRPQYGYMLGGKFHAVPGETRW